MLIVKGCRERGPAFGGGRICIGKAKEKEALVSWRDPQLIIDGSDERQRPSHEQSPLRTTRRRRPTEQSLRPGEQPGALHRAAAAAPIQRRGSEVPAG